MRRTFRGEEACNDHIRACKNSVNKDSEVGFSCRQCLGLDKNTRTYHLPNLLSSPCLPSKDKGGTLKKSSDRLNIFAVFTCTRSFCRSRGGFRVIQSSLALATNEEQALGRWERLPSYSEHDWCGHAAYAAALTRSPRRLSPQRQAGRGSEVTCGSSWQNA